MTSRARLLAITLRLLCFQNSLLSMHFALNCLLKADGGRSNILERALRALEERVQLGRTGTSCANGKLACIQGSQLVNVGRFLELIKINLVKNDEIFPSPFCLAKCAPLKDSALLYTSSVEFGAFYRKSLRPKLL
jgi:hypothetical protein